MMRLMGALMCVSMMGCQRLGDEDAIWMAEEDIAPQSESVGDTICPTTQDSDLMFNPEEK
jgi:hypothetical protein